MLYIAFQLSLLLNSLALSPFIKLEYNINIEMRKTEEEALVYGNIGDQIEYNNWYGFIYFNIYINIILY